MLADISYIYTRGTNLNFATDIDQVAASNLGCVGGYSVCNPNPNFTAIQAQNYFGWSNYNALQLRLLKRLSFGLDFQFNYSWSKSLDTGTGSGHGSGVDTYQSAYSPAINYGLSNFNATSTFTGQVAYAIPFGVGRTFALHGLLDEVLGGWRVSTVLQAHTGIPFTPYVQSSVANAVDPALSSGRLFPQVVGNPYALTQSTGLYSQWFNPNAYANPAYGTFGNSGRNTLIGPGFANIDISFGKTFVLPWEEIKIDVRGDAYNAFNHLNWGNPDAAVGHSNGVLADPRAGQFTTLTTTNRTIQLGTRLTF